MKAVPTSKKIREIIGDVQDGKLIPRPPFQRRRVWSSRDKSYFLDTVLKNYPFPEIYFANGPVDVNTGKGATLLVDGQQRVSTLVEYFIGSEGLKLGSDTPPYRDLHEHQKLAFLEYDVAVRNLGSLSDVEIIDVFQRINITSYNLNDMEINNALYSGALKTFAATLAEHDFFASHRTFKPAQLKRMGDVRYALTIVITMMKDYFNRDELLEEYLKRYNDEFSAEAELKERVERTFDLVDSLGFGPKSRVWQQTDLFTLLIEVDRMAAQMNSPLNTEKVFVALSEFYEAIESENVGRMTPPQLEYYTASIQAANDRGNRVRRGQAIREVLGSTVADDSGPTARTAGT